MYEEPLITHSNTVQINSLHALEQNGLTEVRAVPYTIKVLLESMIRNQAKLGLPEQKIRQLVISIASNEKVDMPLLPTRVIMQDASGVPALVDLVSLRQCLQQEGYNPVDVNPVIPVDLVIDHSIQVNHFGTASAFLKNLQVEYDQNQERYTFLKWAQAAFQKFRVVPPANGIIHQVNLECLTKVVQLTNDGGNRVAHPEWIIGTDSHTTMVNALGVLGWGVGGIEAEAAMLGTPLSMQVPEVVGVNITGTLNEGVTATDMALTITQLLRRHGVVGKFVEFTGPSMKKLTLPDRATIANMAPEYGATCGFFPVDEETLKFLHLTGKTDEEVQLVEDYCKEQGLFHFTDSSLSIRYASQINFDLSTVEASVSGPKRPQDRVPLHAIRESFPTTIISNNKEDTIVKDGSIVIAAITSCTNTANPVNMITAGLLAKRAVELGLTVPKMMQTSLSPGSKAVTEYLEAAGLLPYLEQLGFYHTGYGCTVCVGNSGDLDELIEIDIQKNDLTVTAILSGNRNFEGRIHPLVKANYLASPPLVVAFAIAGTIDINLDKEPLGKSLTGEAIYLKDIWPESDEVKSLVDSIISDEMYRKVYANVFEGDSRWKQLVCNREAIFNWDEQSTYFKTSPFFDKQLEKKRVEIHQARVLLKLEDSITTDHISPVGYIAKESPAGQYLLANGVKPIDFNTYGSRRGNHEVLVRGTFAHPKLKNRLVDQLGGMTHFIPSGKIMDVYAASLNYQKANTPLIILAGKEYGTGSARDWAAKGTYLLGVKAIIAESFERIHRSNLAMMGIVPLQFLPGESYKTLNLSGLESYNIHGLNDCLSPLQKIRVDAKKADGSTITFQTVLRLETKVEIDFYEKNGIFRYILDKWKVKAGI